VAILFIEIFTFVSYMHKVPVPYPGIFNIGSIYSMISYMSWIYNDMIIRLWHITANHIARSMESNFGTFSYPGNCHFHWLVHRFIWPIVGFPQISHAAIGVVVAVIVWQLKLQLPMQLVPITT